jgi:hypothetical protein
MGVREGGVHQVVAPDEKAGAVYGVGAALKEDVFGVIEVAAVGACGGIWGGGAVVEGVVPLERVARDDLEGRTLEAA